MTLARRLGDYLYLLHAGPGRGTVVHIARDDAGHFPWSVRYLPAARRWVTVTVRDTAETADAALAATAALVARLLELGVLRSPDDSTDDSEIAARLRARRP